jgi:tetratricopeptide (TPR) repeat protein
LESRHNLAVVLDDEGRWPEAKKIYEQVLADKRRVLGPEHVDTLSAMNNLAVLLNRHGDSSAALVLLDEAYEAYRAVLGPENLETLRVQINLGQYAFLLGLRDRRPDLLKRSENVLQAAIAIGRRVLPPEHPDLLHALHNLGSLLRAWNRGDEAEPLLKEALAGRQKTLGPGNPDTLATVLTFVLLLDGRKKSADAIRLSDEGLAAADKAGTTDSPTAIDLLLLRVDLSATDHPPQSLAPAERAVALTRKVFGETGEPSLRAQAKLGKILLRLDRPADAEPHLRAAYNGYHAAGSTRSSTFDAAGALGDCLVALKHYADAEPILQDSFEALRTAGASKKVLQVAGERVAKLYEAWGKPEKAAEWREKLN